MPTAPGAIRSGHVTCPVAADMVLAIVTGCGAGAAPVTGTTVTGPSGHRAVPVLWRPRHMSDPVRLPETDAKPSSGASVVVRVRILWMAITHDSPSMAASAFFPESAYRQVKAIWNPGGDYRTHLGDVHP